MEGVYYEIPDHLKEAVGSMPEKELCKTITILIEYAIHNKMIQLPKRDTESDLLDIKKLCINTRSEMKELMTQLLEKINSLEAARVSLPVEEVAVTRHEVNSNDSLFDLGDDDIGSSEKPLDLIEGELTPEQIEAQLQAFMQRISK